MAYSVGRRKHVLSCGARFMKKVVCLSLSSDLVESIELNRGPLARSTYVEKLLRKAPKIQIVEK